MTRRYFLTTLITTCFILSCNQTTITKSKTEFLLDTTCQIKVYQDISHDVLDKAFARVREIDRKMDVNKPDSEVSEINRNAGINPVKVSKDTFFVIQKAVEYAKISKGKFDITIGPLVKLWAIGTDNENVPTDNEIQEVLPLVDYRNIFLDSDRLTVFLKKPEMLIDLGGIAKGYAADQAVAVLVDHGVKYALIDFGGNIFTLGSKPNGSAWNIAVQHPNASRNIYAGILPIENRAMVTSGLYERYFIKDGIRYHHIIDPDTGKPVRNKLVSVTIVGDTATGTDALSTAVFLMGLDDGYRFTDIYAEIDAIFIDRDDNFYLNEDIMDKFNLTSKEFNLKNRP